MYGFLVKKLLLELYLVIIIEKRGINMKKNSKKEKINPIMEKQGKVKKIKMGEAGSDDENVVKKFIIITIVIAIFIGIIYGFTELFKNKEEPIDESVAGSINYDKVSVGTILNRPYDEYYVLVYNSEDTDAVIYSTILTKYMKKSEDKDYIKIYYCDLNNKLNNNYYNVGNDNMSNKEIENVDDFDFGKLTLLQIKNGKVTKYLENIEDIKELLK